MREVKMTVFDNSKGARRAAWEAGEPRPTKDITLSATRKGDIRRAITRGRDLFNAGNEAAAASWLEWAAEALRYREYMAR